MYEELIIRHCSPTLAGLKTGNLFSCPCPCSVALKDEIRCLNRRLSTKGLRILPLKVSDKALIYVYRPKKLKKDLAHEIAGDLLKDCGYNCRHPERCIAKLSSRLKESEAFPHEIGLFLGYPPEDVQGFIENGAKKCKCCGCWKVYGDEKEAQKTFAKYKKCTTQYMRQLSKGTSIDRLTVAV